MFPLWMNLPTRNSTSVISVSHTDLQSSSIIFLLTRVANSLEALSTYMLFEAQLQINQSYMAAVRPRNGNNAAASFPFLTSKNVCACVVVGD